MELNNLQQKQSETTVNLSFKISFFLPIFIIYEMIFGAVATFLETLNVSRIEPFTCSTVHLSIVATFFHPNRTVLPLAVNLSFSSVPTLIGSRPTRLLECVLLCEDRRNCDGAR